MKKVFVFLLMIASIVSIEAKNPVKKIGTQISAVSEVNQYSDNRPAVSFRLDAKDYGVGLKHGSGPDQHIN